MLMVPEFKYTALIAIALVIFLWSINLMVMDPQSTQVSF